MVAPRNSQTMPKTSAKTTHPLAQAPLDELAAELERRKAALPKLLSRRDKLRSDLELVEAQIATLQGLDGSASSSGRRGSGRKAAKKTTTRKKTGRTAAGRGGAKKEPTLREKIAKVLGTDPMRPVEIARALVDDGLHHGSKSLQIQVSTTLAKFEEFSKVARGQWVNRSGRGR